ncbi:DUF2085 domain-containing protein [Mycoplasmatota bacterium]|nr:DUF2085 domain-containing protein [Mycoplasmatota bacterium]
MKKNFFDVFFHCHKLPERSFFYKDKQFPICSRCTGIFIGYIIGIISLILGIFFPFLILKFWISILLIIPMLIDGSIQFFTHYRSNNYKRLITGVLAGFGIIFFLYYIALLGMAHGRWVVDHLLSYF